MSGYFANRTFFKLHHQLGLLDNPDQVNATYHSAQTEHLEAYAGWHPVLLSTANSNFLPASIQALLLHV